MADRTLEDWEFPDSDDDETDDSETLDCPSCGAQVYEHADRCPHCGRYITPYSTSVFAGRPWWYVALALLGIVAVIYLLVNS